MHSLDLTDETIKSTLQNNFVADQSVIRFRGENGDSLTHYKLQRDISFDQLAILYNFLKTPSPVQPPQLDITSSQRLGEIDMTLADADLILKRFNQRTGLLGEEVDATDLNYLALKDATEFFLKKEEGITALYGNKTSQPEK
jgi:hypothetical protein